MEAHCPLAQTSQHNYLTACLPFHRDNTSHFDNLLFVAVVTCLFILVELVDFMTNDRLGLITEPFPAIPFGDGFVNSVLDTMEKLGKVF